MIRWSHFVQTAQGHSAYDTNWSSNLWEKRERKHTHAHNKLDQNWLSAHSVFLTPVETDQQCQQKISKQPVLKLQFAPCCSTNSVLISLL